MNPLNPVAMVLSITTAVRYMDGFGIIKSRKVDKPLNKETTVTLWLIDFKGMSTYLRLF